ncbi:DNA polymerase zeta catalytic subunit-like isoform X2 [Gordionus sp. m RMFG-2023]|uniref:DNA polymerase zeta catalytic subunit-like isoform X2 n=1 Tax=Gordionus sp. m RMFG-2023 TaxID=3053472 RepID=UPI0031FD3100
MLSVKIIDCDYYMAPPLTNLDINFSEFRNSSIKFVPILRIFGNNIKGQTCCLHLHGYFPYLSIQWELSTETLTLQKMADDIDSKLNQKQMIPHVHNIVHFEAKSMYGYTNKSQNFLRIFFYNPTDIKKIADLLIKGELLDGCHQPFEAHIPFHLKFFLDFNLFGMNYINIKKFVTRNNVSIHSDEFNYGNHIIDQKKMSFCPLEIDAKVVDILNSINDKMFPGLQEIIDDDKIIRTYFEINSISSSVERLNVKPLVSESTVLNIIQSKKINSELPICDKKSQNTSNNLSHMLQLYSEDIDHNVSLYGLEKLDDILSKYDTDDEDEISEQISLSCDTYLPQIDENDSDDNKKLDSHVTFYPKIIKKTGHTLCDKSKHDLPNKDPTKENNTSNHNKISLNIKNTVKKKNISLQILSSQTGSLIEEKFPVVKKAKLQRKLSKRTRILLIKPKKLLDSNLYKEKLRYICDTTDEIAFTEKGSKRSSIFQNIYNKLEILDNFSSKKPGLQAYLNSVDDTRKHDSDTLWLTPALSGPVNIVKDEVLKNVSLNFKSNSMPFAESFGKTINMSIIRETSLLNIKGLTVPSLAVSDIPIKVFDLQKQNYLKWLSCEVHTEVRGDMTPNSQHDAIHLIIYSYFEDSDEYRKQVQGTTSFKPASDDYIGFGDMREKICQLNLKNGCCVVSDKKSKILNLPMDNVYISSSEIELLKKFYDLVTRTHDPDILIAYENEKSSWGYICARAKKLGLVRKPFDYLSRVCINHNNENCLSEKDIDNDATNQKHDYEVNQKNLDNYQEYNVKIVGRIYINVWRSIRKLIILNNYTFENVMFHLLHLRTSKYSHKTLSNWYNEPCQRWRVYHYHLIRSVYVHAMLHELDIVEQTSEFAKLYGIEFDDVLHRGSQYRVESMMLRLAKSQGYIPISPSPLQRTRMQMSQMIPLILEPEAGFYSDPILVFDFQSLYPSIIIAYNYCYTTCLGYLDKWTRSDQPFKFGCVDLKLDMAALEKIQSSTHVSPVGVGFVGKDILIGVLPNMLEQILGTRIKVKKTLKLLKAKNSMKNSGLEKLLHTRQMALKMISNVTFGYTSAYFSGRMPCVEIADSILGKAREILQTSIDYINSKQNLNARVIYGDTDSIFVLLKDTTKAKAFSIGEDLAHEITQIFRDPIELKFEKVYHPCILQTKKRYVGLSYENINQKEPNFDAKGIETVRRDYCAAVPKVLEKVITDLFKTGNISQIRDYLQMEFCKIMEGKISLQDYIIAREYRGRKGYKPKACVPSLEIAKRLSKFDPMAEPLLKERVAYVVVNPDQTILNQRQNNRFNNTLPLISLIRTPQEFLQMPASTLNANYYITKQLIPPINRIMSLIGIDVLKWYEDIPRVIQFNHYKSTNSINIGKKIGKDSITHFLHCNHCFICRKLSSGLICLKCKQKPQYSTYIIMNLLRKWSKRYDYLSQVCKTCVSSPDNNLRCISLDCPVFYHIIEANKRISQFSSLQNMENEIDLL